MRRSHWITPAVAGLAAAALWWTFGTTSRDPAFEAAAPPGFFDFFAYYRPNAHYAFERLAGGDLPLWNPHQGFGLPFLATLQTGVLYPPNWLHILLPTQLAFAVLAAAHLALAAVFAAALARSLGAGAPGALAAGLLFGGSSWMLGSLWTPPTLYCAAWFPGVLLAVNALVDRPCLRYGAALAGALAMQGFTGWPYVLLMSAVAGALFGGAALLEVGLAERRVPWERMALLAGFALAGVLLAAPQLLPATELVSLSSREFGRLASSQTVLLDLQHDPANHLSQLLSRGWSDAVPGLLSLPLAALALLRPHPRRIRLAILLGVGVFGLLVSFPNHVPLYDWLRHLPLFGDFRFPFRYRLLTTLSLSVAAGVGVSRVADLVARSERTRLVSAGALAAALVAAQSVPILPTVTRFPRSASWPLSPERRAILRELATRATDGSRVYWQLGTETARLYKAGQIDHLHVTHDLEPLSLASTARFLNYFQTGNASAIEASDLAAVPFAFFGFVRVPRDGSRAQLLDLASVRFVLPTKNLPWLAERYRRVEDLGELPAIFENTAALPRAYRAVRAEAEPASAETALQRLAAPGFDPRAVVMLDAPPAGLEAVEVAEATAADRGSAQVERDEPEYQSIRTRGERSAVLVFTDAFYPGWEATLDGEPARLLRANTAFRAVAVPAGEHRVEMRYRPPAFFAGILLSAAVLAAGAVLWGLRRRLPSAASARLDVG